MTKRIIDNVRELAALCRPSWAAMSEAIERSGVPTMLGTAGLRDKAKDLEGKIATAREERVPLQKVLDSAIEAYAGQDVGEDSDAFQKAKDARGAVGAVDDKIATWQSQLNDTIMLADADGGRSDARPSGDPTDPRAGWDSAKLFENDATLQLLNEVAHSASRFGQERLGQVVGRDALHHMLAAAEDPVEPLSIQRRGPFRGVQEQLRQKLTLLSLIPKGTMDNNTFEYGREEGPLTGEAKAVKEGVKKPQGSFAFTPASAKAETIAEFMKLKKQQLEDVPSLRSIVDNRLRYLLERELERQVLVGSGTDPELQGILPVSGKGVVKYTDGGDLTTDKILSGITTVLLANATADVIVMHPLDWEAALKAKAEGGDMQYYGGGPFAVTPQTMWGVTLVPAVAIPQGRPVVADLSIGVELLFRTGIGVLLSDADGTDFTDNMVTVLAELRAANVIWRPSAFAEVLLTKAAEEAAEEE